MWFQLLGVPAMPYLTTNMSTLKDNVSQLKDFLAYLATVKGDLSNITAPPFILAPKSAIEIPSSWASRQALFLAPASEPDPAQRALLVAQNFLCSLKASVSGGTENAGKKPLNPFLGELFLGTLDSDDEEPTQLVAEQVSHHPPVTACFMHNGKHGISSNGFAAQETSFNPTSGVTVKQIGYAIVRLARFNEAHLMTMPTLHVRGLATGRPYPELEGTCYISSSSGFITKIGFESRGKLGFGSANGVTAEISKSSNPAEVLFRITGQWNGKFTVKDANSTVTSEFHVDDTPSSSVNVVPTEQQSLWESRRAWGKVFEGIREGDIEKVNSYKTMIEESQRARRADEKARGIQWEPRFFSNMEHDEETRRLMSAIPDEAARKFDASRTAGLWKFKSIQEAEDAMAKLKQEHAGLQNGA